MKVPIKCGLVQKLDMVGGRDTSKDFYGFLEAIPQGPVLVCLEEDQAKALGQAMACRTERPILCIDRVKPPRDGFLDIGPRAGAAYPLVVKTLVFGKEQHL